MAATLLASLAAASCSSGGSHPATASPPRGTYTAEVSDSSSPSFDGHWAMTFTASAVTVTLNGSPFVTDKTSYDTGTGTVTFTSEPGPHACPEPGTYRWSRHGGTLRFSRINDTCPGRVSTLAHPFSQQG